MNELVQRYLWVIALVGVFGLYLGTPRDWWPPVTFSLVGSLFLMKGVIRSAEYYYIHRRLNILFFSIVYFIFAGAIMLGGLASAPHPVYDFSGLRTYSRILWSIGLPLFAVAVAQEYRWIYLQIRKNHE